MATHTPPPPASNGTTDPALTTSNVTNGGNANSQNPAYSNNGAGSTAKTPTSTSTTAATAALNTPPNSINAHTPAAAATSNGDAASLSASAKKTPTPRATPRNNYSNVHTPIASAKRPRASLGRQSSRGATPRATPRTAAKSAAATPRTAGKTGGAPTSATAGAGLTSPMPPPRSYSAAASSAASSLSYSVSSCSGSGGGASIGSGHNVSSIGIARGGGSATTPGAAAIDECSATPSQESQASDGSSKENRNGAAASTTTTPTPAAAAGNATPAATVATPGVTKGGNNNANNNAPPPPTPGLPMSPMHPPRPMRSHDDDGHHHHHHHGNGAALAASIEEDAAIQGDAPEEAAAASAETGGSAAGGWKINNLFSPVLSFLGGSKDEDDEDGAAHAHGTHDPSAAAAGAGAAAAAADCTAAAKGLTETAAAGLVDLCGGGARGRTDTNDSSAGSGQEGYETAEEGGDYSDDIDSTMHTVKKDSADAVVDDIDDTMHTVKRDEDAEVDSEGNLDGERHVASPKSEVDDDGDVTMEDVEEEIHTNKPAASPYAATPTYVNVRSSHTSHVAVTDANGRMHTAAISTSSGAAGSDGAVVDAVNKQVHPNAVYKTHAHESSTTTVTTYKKAGNNGAVTTTGKAEDASYDSSDVDVDAIVADAKLHAAEIDDHQASHDVSHDASQQSEASEEDDEEEFNPYLFIKSLPHYSLVVPYPHHKICLPPKATCDPPIALVLDLDETLVHCTVEPTPDADMVFPVVFNGVEYSVNVRKRPYLEEFLHRVHGNFEVIVFTASQQVYADELLDRIDPGRKYIKHRMFRESCLPVEGNYLKDLNVLGRDLRKAVLVDNSPHAFGYQIDNGIPIESWFDDPNDTELLKLERFLRTLHEVEDVRSVVREKFGTYKLIRDA